MKNNAEKRGYEIGVGFNWLRSGTDSKFENGWPLGTIGESIGRVVTSKPSLPPSFVKELKLTSGNLIKVNRI